MSTIFAMQKKMSKRNEKQPIPHEAWIVFAAGIGSAAGASLGIAFDQLVFAVAVGLGAGVVMGIIIYAILRTE